MSNKSERDEQKSERFNMFLSPTEMQAIDDWAWKNKIRSKSEAVRRLTTMGMALDAQINGLSETRLTLWETFHTGSDLALDAVNVDHPDWQKCALIAMMALSKLAEPLTVLSHQIETAASQAALLKSSEELRVLNETSQKVEAASKVRLEQILMAYKNCDEGGKE